MVILVAGSGMTISHFYGEEVKAVLVKEINKNIAVEIEVEAIEFSALRKFPHASIIFKGVYCPSVGNEFEKDTLVFAESVFLQFNLFDIFSGNYTIQQVHLEDAQLNIEVTQRGKNNYQFWKSPDKGAGTQSEKGPISYELDEVDLQNVSVTYTDRFTGLDLSFSARQMKAGGSFYKKRYSVSGSCDLMLDHFSYGDQQFTNQHLVADMLFQKDSNAYHFNTAEILLNNLAVVVNGSLVSRNDWGYDTDLMLNGKNLDIAAVLLYLPNDLKQAWSDYQLQGRLDCETQIKGKWGHGYFPAVSMSYDIKRGKAVFDTSGFFIDHVEMKGVFNYGVFEGEKAKTEDVKVHDFAGNIGTDKIRGKFHLSSFTSPVIDVTLEATPSLRNLHKSHFPGMDLVEDIGGTVTIDLGLKGSIKGFENYTRHDLNRMNVSGTIDLSNVHLKLINTPQEVEDLTGTLVFNDKDAFINELSGEVGSSNFSAEGFFKNVLPYVFLEDEKLFVHAILKSGNIDLDELLAANDKSAAGDTAYLLTMPEKINMELGVELEKLKFRRFEAENIKGKLQLKNKKLLASDLSLDAMDGTVKANGVVDGSFSNKVLISCDASIQNMDVNQLFYQFENFGQTIISEDNLAGIADADIQFGSVWSPSLDCDLKKVYAKADLEITKGRLRNYEMLMALSDYIEVNELKDVRFSKLSNTIEIKDEEIHIPKMEIKSSALDIILSGIHGFDNKVNYNFRVYLPELLANKTRKRKKENNEFGHVEDDGLGMWLFLTMKGTLEDLIVRYDKKEAIKKIGEDIKEEKQTLKQILNEEFGWFKKDTTLKKKKKEKFDDEYFIIEWEEDSVEQEMDEDDDDF